MGYSQRDVSETALSLQYHDNDFIKKQCENRFHSFTCLKTISIQYYTGETAVSLRFHPSRGCLLPIPQYAKDA